VLSFDLSLLFNSYGAMISTLFAAAMLGLAGSSPVPSQQHRSLNYPPTLESRGFVLVANVTHLSKDNSPSVHHWYLSGVHLGSGHYEATLVPEMQSMGYYFQNGTKEEIESYQGNVVVDTGFGPYGVTVSQKVGEEYEYLVGASIAAKQRQIGITLDPQPFAFLQASMAGTFAYCNNAQRNIESPAAAVRFIRATYGSHAYNDNMPSNCFAISLLPQCTPLRNLTESSSYNHDFAQPVRCYENVSAIDWPNYNPY
jgi:hypothetical protein